MSAPRSKKNNQYDGFEILKEVGDFDGQSLRVHNSRSVADKFYSHFRVTYDVNSNPTEVYYYKGTKPHITSVGCLADVAGSLNNKYFFIYSNPEAQKYHVWFNVNGAGVDPAPTNSTPIQIDLSLNDPAVVVAAAISITINNLFKEYFIASKVSSVVEIRTVGYGEIFNSTDFNTTFVIANQVGEQEVTNHVIIDYDGESPIYNGEVLKGYRFNIFDGNFEHKEDINLDNVELNIETAQTPTIQNITLASSVTEYSVTFPIGTRKILVKVRGYESSLKLAWTASGTSSNYITVPRGNSYVENDIELASGLRTLYINANKDNIIIECLSWA